VKKRVYNEKYQINKVRKREKKKERKLAIGPR